MKIVKNDLFDYENRYIYQFENGYKFSLDSILLAEYVDNIRKDDVIVDLCSGNAPIPLILSTKYKNKIYGIELQDIVYDLAVKSINLCDLSNQIELINDDVKNLLNHFNKKSINVITCNPPYFTNGNDKVINKEESVKISRHELTLDLDTLFSTVREVLIDNGTFFLIHRANRIDEIIIIANSYRLNVKKITFIDTKSLGKPKMVLIKCVKNAKFGVSIEYKSVLNLKTYKNIFKEKL